MIITRATKNGQVTLPKSFRCQFDTQTYRCVTEGNKCICIPITVSELGLRNEKTSLEEAIEELDDILSKMDFDAVPSLKQQLKGIQNASNPNTIFAQQARSCEAK